VEVAPPPGFVRVDSNRLGWSQASLARSVIWLDIAVRLVASPSPATVDRPPCS
jgi:hypothetical protein